MRQSFSHESFDRPFLMKVLIKLFQKFAQVEGA